MAYLAQRYPEWAVFATGGSHSIRKKFNVSVDCKYYDQTYEAASQMLKCNTWVFMYAISSWQSTKSWTDVEFTLKSKSPRSKPPLIEIKL